MSDDCLFCSIAAGDLEADVVRTSDDMVAFRDINPAAPTHVLVVPRAHYANAGDLAAADPGLAGRLLAEGAAVAEAVGVAESGYRLVLNTGEAVGQSVFHVHLHVLGGRQMSWPPG